MTRQPAGRQMSFSIPGLVSSGLILLSGCRVANHISRPATWLKSQLNYKVSHAQHVQRALPGQCWRHPRASATQAHIEVFAQGAVASTWLVGPLTGLLAGSRDDTAACRAPDVIFDAWACFQRADSSEWMSGGQAHFKACDLALLASDHQMR